VIVRTFQTKWFARFARQERIPGTSLREAVDRAKRGLIDADLGGGLIKQRVARPGKGRSGGYRVLIAYVKDGRAVFLYGFAKNERENLELDELLTVRTIAATWLAADDERIRRAILEKELQEISDEQTGD
jgi:hypothetical protein